VVIIDESDEHTFNDPGAFMKFTRKAACVCLTATYAEDYDEGIERSVLKKMDFRIFDKLYNDPEKKFTEPTFRRIENMPDENICEFIEERTQEQAMLLYCGSEFKNKLLTRFGFATYIDHAVSHTALRSLD